METQHDIRLAIGGFGQLKLYCKTPGHNSFFCNTSDCTRAKMQVRDRLAKKLEIETFSTVNIKPYRKVSEK